MKGIVIEVMALLLTLVLTACGGQPDPGTPPPTASATVFVGEVSGSDALIALVIENDTVLAYVCGASSWQTHTGWVYTQLSATKSLTGSLKAASSTSGLTLAGELNANGANGTVTLKNGTVLNWKAEPAKPGTAAGLYILENAGSLVGLIVTNGGKTAGTARMDNLGKLSSAPVVVKQLPNQPSPNGIAVNFTFPNLPPLEVTLIPVQKPSESVIVPESPTVVILLHGATTQAPTPDEICPSNITVQPVIATRQHARCYWSAQFVNGVLNGPEPGKGLKTLFTFNNQDVSDENNSNDFETTSLAGDEFTDFISNETISSLPVPKAPKLSVLLTYRDASKGLIKQSVNAVDQIYASIQKYISRFKVAPKLVFLGHSYGGLVTRFILSNPSIDDLKAAVGTIDIPTGINYNAANGTRDKMSFLRNRAYYAVTMSSPHEGVKLAGAAGDVLSLIQHLLIGLNNQTNLQPNEKLIVNGLLAIAQGMTNLNVNNPITVDDIRGALERIRAKYENTIVTEASMPFWFNLNKGPLHPQFATRSSTTPIIGAGNRLVPIYVAGGRSPGADVYDTLNIQQSLEEFSALNKASKRDASWLLESMTSDMIANALGGFGPPEPGFETKLDRRERVGFADEARRLMQARFNNLDFFVKDYFGLDINNALHYVYSIWDVNSLATKGVLPIYLSHKFQFDLGNSITVNVPAFVCGTNNVRLNFQAVLNSLVAKYGSIQAALSSISSLDLASLLTQLAITSLDTAAQFTQWLTNGITALGDKVKDGCLNPSNWKLGTVPVIFPAPRLLETTQATSDKEIDYDGLVHYTSAMGFRLGTITNEFFDHTRNDIMFADKPAPGSWYRRYSSEIEPYHHNILFFVPGHWVYTSIIGQNPGPLPANQGEVSVYP